MNKIPLTWFGTKTISSYDETECVLRRLFYSFYQVYRYL